MKKENSEEEIFQDLLDRLLSKDKEHAMRLSIEGYPSDYLEPKMQSLKGLRKEYHQPMVNGENYIGFEVMRGNGDGLDLGPIYNSDADAYMIKIDGTKAWYRSTNMHKMLNDCNDPGVFKIINNEDVFVIRLGKQYLRDNADWIE